MPKGIWIGYKREDVKVGLMRSLEDSYSREVVQFVEGIRPSVGDEVEWENLGMSQNVKVTKILRRSHEIESQNAPGAERR